MSGGATNQVEWRAHTVANLISKIEPPSSGRSSFLAKRECLCTSIWKVLPHRLDV
jgi:hypothetical protein